ncbi:hypothetical protein E3P92_00607 [Wallemia ichthyophaga]|uniref:Ribosomal protein S11 n=1 Tax=Wallemia ichthyophaga TaxID=245174 RepID=A0A4T0HQY7_WALIC|nr:hypothetical protein E3P98_02638 [Wallemia ichthyophaga]TIA99195.1 hypothetical protein E3P95_02171 [Wallemia ichthyophaga]TIB04585.1 hypothetical protein E3P94_00553 [Wallemia ichthyophaga]TIB16622.1 hypothetical protein E3P90_00364 [Wallemia ichthyophaga]TIB18248.1 hypothetical protein E3P93_00221 [Wallemia ichthyophaga]
MNAAKFTKNLTSSLNAGNAISYNKSTTKSIINVHSTRNNTIITLTNNLNQPLTWISSGSIGFKSAQKAGYEAGYQSTIALFNKINDSSIDSSLHQSKFGPLELHFRGEAFKQRLSLVKDKTNLVRGGTRPKKQRRL